MKIGEFLVEKGVLSQNERDQILTHQKRVGLRFGDAALDLGILRERDLIRVFGKSYRIDFFHVSARHFPETTARLLPAETLIRLGALPLGVKNVSHLFSRTQRLNLGLLDPSDSEAHFEVRSALKEHTSLKIYLILADQMMSVLNEAYGLTDEEVLRFPNVHPLLTMV